MGLYVWQHLAEENYETFEMDIYILCRLN